MHQGGSGSRARNIARVRDITAGISVGLCVAVAMAAATRSAPRSAARTVAISTTADAPWIERSIERERAALRRARTLDDGSVIDATVAPVTNGYVSLWAMAADEITLRCASLGRDGSLRARPVAVSPSGRDAMHAELASFGDRVVVTWVAFNRGPQFEATPMWAVVNKDCAVLRPASPLALESRVLFRVHAAFDGERAAFVARGFDRGVRVDLAIIALDGTVISKQTLAADHLGLVEAVTATDRGFLVAFDEFDFSRSKSRLRTALFSTTGTYIQTRVLRQFDGPVGYAEFAAGSERGLSWSEDGTLLANRHDPMFARVRSGEAQSPVRISERSTTSTPSVACNARGCLHGSILVGPEVSAQPRLTTEFRDVDGRVERGPTEHAVSGVSLRRPPSIAASADGTSFLALTTTSGALYAQRFDHSGRPQGAPVALH